VARLIGEQSEQDEAQFAPVEHPPAPSAPTATAAAMVVPTPEAEAGMLATTFTKSTAKPAAITMSKSHFFYLQ
jgi:hypothetical protein